MGGGGELYLYALFTPIFSLHTSRHTGALAASSPQSLTTVSFPGIRCVAAFCDATFWENINFIYYEFTDPTSPYLSPVSPVKHRSHEYVGNLKF